MASFAGRPQRGAARGTGAAGRLPALPAGLAIGLLSATLWLGLFRLTAVLF